MKNQITINGYQAVIDYDPEIDLFRGEFIGLNGGADFYARDLDGLRREGALSLQIFLDACAEDGVPPRKAWSGRFNARIPPDLHAQVAQAAAAHGISLNQFVERAIRNEINL